MVLLTISITGDSTNLVEYIPNWLMQGLQIFGGMMAALGLGILLSFLVKRKIHFAVFMVGFVLIGYFGGMISVLGVAVIATIVAAIYYTVNSKKEGVPA